MFCESLQVAAFSNAEKKCNDLSYAMHCAKYVQKLLFMGVYQTPCHYEVHFESKVACPLEKSFGSFNGTYTGKEKNTSELVKDLLRFPFFLPVEK